jgi:glycosyltransferase involved in cell wall biosynthesis
MSAPPAEPTRPHLMAGSRPRRRVGLVVQRFGDGLLGGAESHAAAMAAVLARHHDLTVLTSCARDAGTWAPELAPGEGLENGLRLWRFVNPPRNEGGRARVPLWHKLRMGLKRLFDAAGRARVAQPRGEPVYDGHVFLQQQGPACTGLIDVLRDNRGGFEAVVFFTSLYHPTAEGLPVWGRRSVLVPLLHDEKPMYLPWFHRVYAAAGQTLWNTAAEQRLARRLYGPHAQPGRVVGVSVQVQAPPAGQTDAARARHGVPASYLIYVGRLEKGKGCAELLAAWRAVCTQAPDAALVFVGRGSLRIEPDRQVRLTGFVDAAERDALIAGAAALVMPSRYESLSAVLLEAMMLGVPVLANGDCEPLADHVRESAGGEAYRGRRELRAGLLRALGRSEAERTRLGEAGRRYVVRNYAPERVAAEWLDAVESVCTAPAAGPGAARSIDEPR